jgi:hypothetical protein
MGEGQGRAREQLRVGAGHTPSGGRGGNMSPEKACQRAQAVGNSHTVNGEGRPASDGWERTLTTSATKQR